MALGSWTLATCNKWRDFPLNFQWPLSVIFLKDSVTVVQKERDEEAVDDDYDHDDFISDILFKN
jgi:hypothetical protein